MSTELNRSLPSGIATFVMTDVEGSTRLHAEKPVEALAALRIHDRLGEAAIASHNGHLIKSKGEGDSLFAVFESAEDALKAIVAFQLALDKADFPEGAHLRMRAALHTGPAEMDDGDYRGSTINRCARLRGIAHGGQVILSTATQQLVADRLPEGVTLQDMGMHRLKDLLQPEQVYQIIHPDLQKEFPALASLGNRPNNLPLQLTSFVGREKEIKEVVDLLSSHRLVTLMGGGGTGKTRLSLQVGAELLDAYPGGVFFVELASIFESDEVGPALANAIRVREVPGVPIQDTISTWLQDKASLLIFDNCEQVAESAGKLIGSLLRTCPKVRVIATSRQALHVTGEGEFRVPSMSTPAVDNTATPETILESESVRLLLERAASKAPNFKLTENNALAVARLCARLDGIPLCLELVAPKLKLYTPEQLVVKLNDVFRVLSGTAVDDIPRHQTIQATVDWSYQLLSDEERAVLSWLSVFPAGCTVEAAEETCSSALAFDIPEVLSQLHDKSMITLEPGEDGSIRQRQLTTVRAFAHEKLKESGQSEEAYDAMLSWCLHISKEANELFLTKGDEEVLDALNAEHANYRAALDWCLQRPPLAVQSLRLAVQLHRYWMRRGHYREALNWLKMALITAGDQASAELRADGLNILGVIAWYQGQLDVAKGAIQESLKLWKEVGNDNKVAATLNNSALLAVQEGDLATARECLTAAAEIWNRQGDMRHVADAYLNLGNLSNEVNDYPSAISYFEKSLTLKRQLADLWGVAMVLGSLAQAYMLTNDLERGTSNMREALSMIKASKDETLASTSLIEAAYLGVLRGHIQLAGRLTGASDAAIERLGIELTVTHKRFRDLVVKAVDEAMPSGAGFGKTSKAGRTLSLQKAVEEALEFVEGSDLVSKN